MPYGSESSPEREVRVSYGPPHAPPWYGSSPLFPLPADSRLGVLQNNPLLQQLVADLIRTAKILGFLSRGPFRNKPFDVGVGDARPRAWLKHVEHGIEEPQQAQNRSHV